MVLVLPTLLSNQSHPLTPSPGHTNPLRNLCLLNLQRRKRADRPEQFNTLRRSNGPRHISLHLGFRGPAQQFGAPSASSTAANCLFASASPSSRSSRFPWRWRRICRVCWYSGFCRASLARLLYLLSVGALRISGIRGRGDSRCRYFRLRSLLGRSLVRL